MRRFKVERQTASDIDSAGTGVPGFLPQLDTQRENLVTLERSARQAFGGCGTLLRMLKRKRRAPEGEDTDPGAMLAAMQEHLSSADTQLGGFAEFPLPRFFNSVSPFIIFLGILVVSIGFAYALGGVNSFTLEVSCVVAAALTLLLVIIYQCGIRKARPLAAEIAGHLLDARRLATECEAAAGGFSEADCRRLQEQCERECAAIDGEKTNADGIESEFRRSAEAKLAAQAPRALEKNEELPRARLAAIESARDSSLGQLTGDAVSRQRARSEAHEKDLKELATEEARRWAEIETS